MKKNFLLFLVPLLLIYVWFQNGGMLAGAEEGLPFYSAAKMWSLSNSLWMPIETGLFAIDLYPRLNLAWLFVVASNFHMPTFLFQAILFYGLMVTGMFSVYLLTKFFLKEHTSRDTIALIAGLFYLLNPYSMTQVWQRGLYAQYFIFALLPLSLYLFAYGLEKKKTLYVYLIAISSFIFSTAFGLVTNIIVFWSVIFFYFCFWLFENRKLKKLIWGTLYFVLTFLSWALINAWWFVPLVLFKQDIFGGKAGDALGNIAILNEVGKYFHFSSLIRLLQDYYFFSPGIYGEIYSYHRMELISWIPPLCILIAFLAIAKVRKLLFFFILFLIALFFCLGSNPPFGQLFTYLFTHNSILQAFRNPYEKYGIVFMLAYTPIFAYGLYIGSSTIQRMLSRIIKIPTLFICLYFFIFIGGIYLWPMWKGLYKTAVNVPLEYTDFNNWLEKHESDVSSRIFVLPFEGEGIATDWNFNGLDSAIFTFDRPSLSYKLQTTYTFDIFHNLYNYMGQVNEFPALSLMNTKYVVVRSDLENEDKHQINEFSTANETSYDQASEKFCVGNLQQEQVTCKFPQTLVNQLQNQLMNVYVDISIRTNIAADIAFQLQNHDAVLAEWADKGNIEYETQKDISKQLLLPIEAIVPTDKDKSSFAPQLLIKTKSLNSMKIPSVTIESIRLIPYSKQIIDEDSLVFEKGKLAVYAFKNRKSQPTITMLSQIKEERTFHDFFTQVAEDKEKIAHIGYIINGQNSDKKIKQFIKYSNTDQISVKSTMISPTRYLIQTNSQKSAVLAFNQTFNPQWKIVQLKNSKDLNYSLLNDFKLLQSTYLSEDKHVIGNGYANFWLLPKEGKTYGIIFLPQVYSDIAGYITAGTLVIIALYLVSRLVHKKRLRKIS